MLCWEALRREGHSRLAHRVIKRLLQGTQILEAQGKSPLRTCHVVKEQALMNVVDRKPMLTESHLYISSLPRVGCVAEGMARQSMIACCTGPHMFGSLVAEDLGAVIRRFRNSDHSCPLIIFHMTVASYNKQ